MFFESLALTLKTKLWDHFLPFFISSQNGKNKPCNYYGVYFSDVKQEKYLLANRIGKNVILEKWNPESKSYSERIYFSIKELEMMNVEIIHWVKNGPLKFDSILNFSINYFTRIAYIKNIIAITKKRFYTKFHSNNEMIGLERVNLLQLLIDEYVHQSPKKTQTGVTHNEIIDMLYGNLWCNYIKNEYLRRKVILLLQSLVITGDVLLQDERYYVQGKAIDTILSWQNAIKNEKQQTRNQKNINRLMLIITASTLIITLAILAQAGIVNLHSLWGHITQLGPFRIIFKLI